MPNGEVGVSGLEMRGRQDDDTKAFKASKAGGPSWRQVRAQGAPCTDAGDVVEDLFKQIDPPRNFVARLYWESEEERPRPSSASDDRPLHRDREQLLR
eukprot:2208414-Pyramimonas_sp.AAC.1